MVSRLEARSTRPALKLTPTRPLQRVALRTTKSIPSTATIRRKAPTKQGRGSPPPPPPNSPAPQQKSSLRSRRVITPGPAINVLQQKKDPSYDASHENNDEESLEDRIRTALTTPKIARHNAGTPTSVKSVRWDPAIVSCGPITPPAPISNSLPSCGNSEPAQSPHEPISLSHKRREISKEVIMQSLTRIKKSDRDTLRRLLDELKNGESEDETRDRPGTQNNKSKNVSDQDEIRGRPGTQNDESQAGSVSLLNPEAPAFRKYATQRAQIAQRKAYANLGKATLTIPRKRPRLLGGEVPRRDLQEPTWVNIFNPPETMPHGTPSIPSAPSSLEAASSHLQQTLPRPFGLPPSDPWAPIVPPANSFMSTQSFMPQIPLPPPIDPPQAIWGPVRPPPGFYNLLPQFGYWVNPGGFPVPQPAQLAQPIQTIQHAQPIQPVQSLKPATFRGPRRPPRPRGDKGPLVDVGPEFIPPEDGPGREARAIQTGWAATLLDKFREKYPQTGRVKAAAAAPTKMRPAAAIQQQLEFILYLENERRAREGGSGDEMLEEVQLVAKHPRTRGERSSEDKPPSYKRYDTATGIKFEFSEDERFTSDEEVSTDEIVTEEKEAFAHLREKSASTEKSTSIEEVNDGEASAGYGRSGEYQIEPIQAEDQTPEAVQELSRNFSNLFIGTGCSNPF